MFEHEGLNVTQQLPQFFEPCLRTIVYANELALTECELLDRVECASFVKGVMNVWGLREVELRVRPWPFQLWCVVGFYLQKVRLRHLR